MAGFYSQTTENGRSQKWVSRFGPLWTFLHMLLKLMVDSLVLKSEEPAEIER